VTARRSASEWYVGAMTGERAQTLRYSLSFLGKGDWVAESYTDAQVTDYVTNPTAVAINQSIVTRKDTIVAALERSGGQAVRFRPATAADIGQLPRYVEPELEVVSILAPDSAQEGDLVTVTATVANPGSVPGGDAIAMSVKDTDIAQTRNVRVDGNGTRTVSFQARLTGRHSARVIIGGERVTVRIERAADAVAAPTGLRVTRFAGSLVALAWDPVPGASYQVFRRTTDSIYGDPIATVPAGTTSYLDTGVAIGNTYSYVVRAVAAGSASIPSNEVAQTTAAQQVQVTWRVRVPAFTPPGDIYMPGSIAELGPWDPGKLAMTRVGTNLWEVTVPLLEGTTIDYKYTRGSWGKVEDWGEIVGSTNRRVTVTFGTTGAQLVDDTSTDPATPDIHEAVRSWVDIRS